MENAPRTIYKLPLGGEGPEGDEVKRLHSLAELCAGGQIILPQAPIWPEMSNDRAMKKGEEQSS